MINSTYLQKKTINCLRYIKAKKKKLKYLLLSLACYGRIDVVSPKTVIAHSKRPIKVTNKCFEIWMFLGHHWRPNGVTAPNEDLLIDETNPSILNYTPNITQIHFSIRMHSILKILASNWILTYISLQTRNFHWPMIFFYEEMMHSHIYLSYQNRILLPIPFNS